MNTKFKPVNYKPINVKNAELLNRNETYVLKHYGTEILRVVKGKVKKCLPVSASSNSAIVQTMKRLKIYNPKTMNTKDLCLKLNKMTINELRAQWSDKITI